MYVPNGSFYKQFLSLFVYEDGKEDHEGSLVFYVIYTRFLFTLFKCYDDTVHAILLFIYIK